MECHRYARGVHSGRQCPAVAFAFQGLRAQSSFTFSAYAQQRLAKRASRFLLLALIARSHRGLLLGLLAAMQAQPPAFQPSRTGGNKYLHVAFQPNHGHQPIPYLALVFLATEFESPALLVLPGRQSGHHVDWSAGAGLLPATLMEGTRAYPKPACSSSSPQISFSGQLRRKAASITTTIIPV